MTGLQCANCGAGNARFVCGQCKSMYYCKQECQSEHWVRAHHRECTGKKAAPPPKSPHDHGHGTGVTVHAAPGNSNGNGSRVGTVNAVDTKHCGQCGTADAQFLCTACRMVHYCGAECQQQHWAKHAKECKRLAASGAAHTGSTHAHHAGPAAASPAAGSMGMGRPAAHSAASVVEIPRASARGGGATDGASAVGSGAGKGGTPAAYSTGVSPIPPSSAPPSQMQVQQHQHQHQQDEDEPQVAVDDEVDAHAEALARYTSSKGSTQRSPSRHSDHNYNGAMQPDHAVHRLDDAITRFQMAEEAYNRTRQEYLDTSTVRQNISVQPKKRKPRAAKGKRASSAKPARTRSVSRPRVVGNFMDDTASSFAKRSPQGLTRRHSASGRRSRSRLGGAAADDGLPRSSKYYMDEIERRLFWLHRDVSLDVAHMDEYPSSISEYGPTSELQDTIATMTAHVKGAQGYLLEVAAHLHSYESDFVLQQFLEERLNVQVRRFDGAVAAVAAAGRKVKKAKKTSAKRAKGSVAKAKAKMAKHAPAAKRTPRAGWI